jgi:hypothetical protein
LQDAGWFAFSLESLSRTQLTVLLILQAWRGAMYPASPGRKKVGEGLGGCLGRVMAKRDALRRRQPKPDPEPMKMRMMRHAAPFAQPPA